MDKYIWCDSATLRDDCNGYSFSNPPVPQGQPRETECTRLAAQGREGPQDQSLTLFAALLAPLRKQN